MCKLLGVGRNTSLHLSSEDGVQNENADEPGAAEYFEVFSNVAGSNLEDNAVVTCNVLTQADMSTTDCGTRTGERCATRFSLNAWFESTVACRAWVVMGCAPLKQVDVPAGVRGQVVTRAEDSDFREAGRPDILDGEEDYMIADIKDVYYMIDERNIIAVERRFRESNAQCSRVALYHV